MDMIMEELSKILIQTITLHVYSFPNFTLELFMSMAISIMYVLLHLEISKIGLQTLKLKPNSVYCKVLPESDSAASICTSITHYQHECTLTYRKPCKTNSIHSHIGWGFGDICNSRKQNEDHGRLVDFLISLTPTEFAKLDKERKLRNKEIDPLKSLTTLYTDAVFNKQSETTFKRQVELVRENIEFAKMSPNNRFGTEGLTNSFFDLLENFARPETPALVRFNGDITSLALDAGNLNKPQSRTNMDKKNDIHLGSLAHLEGESYSGVFMPDFGNPAL